MARPPARTVWPDLSLYPHVAGRAARTEDVEAERAVFVLENKGKPVGKPIAMKIPQYAYHVSGASKKPCVIIQAETGQGKKVFGCLTIPDGTQMVGLHNEFELLGDKPPAK